MEWLDFCHSLQMEEDIEAWSHIMLDIWANLCAVTYKIGVVVTSPVTTPIVDSKRLGPDHSSQDELWRPDHQGGLHVLDSRGREETSSGLESDTWALGEDFKHAPVGAPTSLKGCLSLLMLTEKFYNLDSFWGEEL